MYDNLCKKYDITKEEVKEFIDFISGNEIFGKWCGDIKVLIAGVDLLANGDIKEDKGENNGN